MWKNECDLAVVTERKADELVLEAGRGEEQGEWDKEL